ncbi:hypothetical protein LDENG_00208970 [Lucifuga dentata]|nr:hypothetical protein LDENG_00208970 [Lucifuga dentata]
MQDIPAFFLWTDSLLPNLPVLDYPARQFPGNHLCLLSSTPIPVPAPGFPVCQSLCERFVLPVGLPASVLDRLSSIKELNLSPLCTVCCTWVLTTPVTEAA